MEKEMLDLIKQTAAFISGKIRICLRLQLS